MPPSRAATALASWAASLVKVRVRVGVRTRVRVRVRVRVIGSGLGRGFEVGPQAVGSARVVARDAARAPESACVIA